MPFNSNGSNRESIVALTPEVQQEMSRANVLISDPRRQRPNWFSGRFLAAGDLANEQNYFLVRQADLGRAGGSGVIEGLRVSEVSVPGTNGERLRVEAGHGVTDTGELVVLRDAVEFDPANVAEIQRLDAAFGLQSIPNEPGRTRTGLYILALRAVEWTANPVAAYPTSLTGQRTVEDGDIIEGVAVTLIPLPDLGEGDWNRRRARVARDIFVEGRNHGHASGTLPLAVVALRGNLVEWVDAFLVRRDAGAARPAGPDFGFGQRALREAHLVQYDEHLNRAVAEMSNQPFQATQWFDALPPAGRIPSNTLTAATLSQRFFPPGIAVDLSFIPRDELPALIEESLLLPPLDLTLDADALAGTTVVVVVPVDRSTFNQNQKKIAGASRRLFTPIIVPRAKASPLDILRRRAASFEDSTASATTADPDWVNLLTAAQAQPFFWFVRRRHLPVFVNQPGQTVNAFDAAVDDPNGLRILSRRMPEIGAGIEQLQNLKQPAVDALTRRLARRSVVERPELLKSLVQEAVAAAEKEGSPAAAVATLSPLADPQFGAGLDRLAAADAALGKSLKSETMATSRMLPEIDRLAREAEPDEVKALVKTLKPQVRTTRNLPGKLTEFRTALTARRMSVIAASPSAAPGLKPTKKAGGKTGKAPAKKTVSTTPKPSEAKSASTSSTRPKRKARSAPRHPDSKTESNPPPAPEAPAESKTPDAS